MMYIPDFLKRRILKDPLANPYFVHAEDAWKRIKDISIGATLYINDDYFVLIDTLRRYYMGFIQSKLDNDPTFSIEKGFLTNNCGFNKLVEKIENAGCVLSAPLNSDEKKERIAFFDELDQIRARKNYALTFTFDDFKSLYEFITIQREAILDYLEPKQVEMQEDFDGIEE